VIESISYVYNYTIRSHLDLVDEEVRAVLVHGQVVERGDEDGHQDLEDVLERGAGLEVAAAKVRKLFLERDV
jgi:hypothetical protein